jgi:predicted DNA-binding transcriptional regulator AlpA
MGTDIKADEIREIFREVLEDFKYELLEELKEELFESSAETQSNASLVRTSEVCKRWGRSRTTLSKLIREKKLRPAGRYGHSFTFRTSDIVALFGEPVY